MRVRQDAHHETVDIRAKENAFKFSTYLRRTFFFFVLNFERTLERNVV